MNVIIQTHFNSQTGKKEANKTSESIEEAYYLVKGMLFVPVFSRRRFVVLAQKMMTS
jgi:hypothetical protein